MSEKLTIISIKQKGESFDLNGDKITVGRGSSNDITLKDSSVSREHCLIEKRGGEFFISDLHSLNGTFVNGKRAENTVLKHGNKVDIGDFTFRFQTGEYAETSKQISFDKTEFRIPKNSVRLRAEEVFGAMARDLTAILRISNKINTIRDAEELQGELLRQIFEVIPAENGAILLIDDDDEIVEMVGLNRKGDVEPVEVSQSIIADVLSKKEVILVTDFASDEDIQKSESLFLSNISTLLCVPIVLFEKTLGVLYLSAAQSNFDEGHLKFLTAIAGISAVAIENARNFAFLENENKRLRKVTFNQNMLGESPAMKKIFEIIAKVSPTDSNVLISGESGTGKELAAQAIHLNSKRKDKPFVAINCAALTENLLESELFGHEKGAFTGAVANKQGKIEIAAGGTLFLDEIGEMALNLQAKLLRVLEAREFERVGGLRSIKANIRLIAATNRNLSEEVSKGNFREDLFYRLNVVKFTMPALRERKEDIFLLAESFIETYSKKMNRKVRGFSANAKSILLKYDFNGNVRELKNIIERAIVLGSSDWILPEDLPEDLLSIKVADETTDELNYQNAICEKKIDLIFEAFEKAGGNYVETAKLLGINSNYLHRLIRKLEIKEELEELS
jgi:Nif-specific regulatory protein